MQQNRFLLIGGGLAVAVVLIVAYFGWSSDSDAIAQLNSKDPGKRIDAINRLSADGSDSAARAIVPLAQDPDDRVASTAIHAVAMSRMPNRAETVRQAMRDQRATVREAAVSAAGTCGSEAADAAALAGVLSGREDPRVRAAAAQSLGRLLAYDSLPQLVAALEDEDVEVRGRAGAAVRILFSNRDVGYRADAPPEERAAAIAKIRAWYPAIQRQRPALQSGSTP